MVLICIGHLAILIGSSKLGSDVSSDTRVAVDVPVRRVGGALRLGRDPEIRIVDFATDKFLADTVGTGRVQYASHKEFGLPDVVSDRYGYRESHEAYPIPTTGLLVQTAHACFATHQAFGLSPDTIWQTIVNQVATHIKRNAEKFERLFTFFTGAKINLEVRDDAVVIDNNWLRVLGKFEEPLQMFVGDELVSLFMPDFSTTGQLERVASLVAFMDAASLYYNYSVETMCHIPLIRLEGTPQDWSELYRRTAALSQRIDGLGLYFDDLLPVLFEICETAKGKTPNDMFWSSIYKFKSSSGGEYVTGWLTALLAFRQTSNGLVPREEFTWRRQFNSPWGALKTNHIPSLLSAVPFIWKVEGREVPMTFVAGTLGVDNTDEVYTPRLGVAVMER